MYVFNGKITIESKPIAIDGTSPQQWKFDVMLSSSNDKNKISKIKAGDFVILNGYDSASLESQYCAYKVISVDNSASLGLKSLTVAWDDQSETIFAPSNNDDNKEGMLGRATSEEGFTMLPTRNDGFDVSTLQIARNVDLQNRDVKLKNFIMNYVKANAGSGSGSGTDSTKLPIAGGTITGDLAVEGTTTLADTTIESGSTRIDINTNGINTKINSNNVADTKNITSMADISSSVVSNTTNGSNKLTDQLMGSASASRAISTSSSAGDAVNTTTVSSDGGNANYAVNANGMDTKIQLNSMGSNSSAVSVQATGDNGVITLSAAKIQLKGDVTASANLTANKNITCEKAFSTTTDTTFADNQLITNKFMHDYVDKAVASGTANFDPKNYVTQTDLTNATAGFMKESTVDSILAEKLIALTTNDIKPTDTRQYVTPELTATINSMQTTINNKQDKLKDGTYLTPAIIGQVGGIVPLDSGKKIDYSYMPDKLIRRLKTIGVPVRILSNDKFEEKYNVTNSAGVRVGDLSGSLFIVTDSDERPDQKIGKPITDWRMVYVYTCDEDDVTSGFAQVEDQQFKYELGAYKANQKIIHWSNIIDPPDGLKGGSSSSWQWYETKVTSSVDGETITDVKVRYFGNGNGIKVVYGTNKATIVVPDGVQYRSLFFLVPPDGEVGCFTSGKNYEIDYDQNAVFCPNNDYNSVFSCGNLPHVAMYMFNGGNGWNKVVDSSVKVSYVGGHSLTLAPSTGGNATSSVEAYIGLRM